jgi:LacI family transcriptional regulator
VAGFDDIELAAMLAPSLSTVRLPLHEIGRLGFAYAERVLAGKRPTRTVLSTEVVLRDSTGAPPPIALSGRRRLPAPVSRA